MATAIVWASPNQDGLTAAAKDRILEGISIAGGATEIIHLNEYGIQSCLACEDGYGICRSEGKCVIEDGFSMVYEKLIAADGIVWVTPVYWHDLAECLKSFLDRLRRCEAKHNHYLKDKECLLVACAGGSGRGAVQCLDHLEDVLDHMGMVSVDRLPIIQFNKSYMLPALSSAGQSFTSYIQKG
jgi:multimeric flavodoxin WrbA